MGGTSSSEERTEEKLVDSNGQVNNNIVIQEAKDTHNQLLLNEKQLYATWILVGFEFIKLGIYIFSTYKKKLKKDYDSKHQPNRS